MLIPFACILLLSPALIVEFSVDRRVFPNDADDWDRIGLFSLKDGGKDRLVLLYYYDSDSVAEKMMAKKKLAMKSYPNFFDVHAVYQDAGGKWVHKEVFGYARVRFKKVAKITPDALDLECRGNFMIRVEAGEDLAKAVKRAGNINKPFTKRLSFVDGVLTVR